MSDYAYRAVVKGRETVIGRVERDRKGYTPCPEHGRFSIFPDGLAMADLLNESEGISSHDALVIALGAHEDGNLKESEK